MTPKTSSPSVFVVLDNKIPDAMDGGSGLHVIPAPVFFVVEEPVVIYPAPLFRRATNNDGNVPCPKRVVMDAYPGAGDSCPISSVSAAVHIETVA